MSDTRRESALQQRDGNGVDPVVPVFYQRADVYREETTRDLSAHVREVLGGIGEDPDREGLLKTPERVAKALQYLTHGYGLDYRAILESALFEEDYSEMILVKDIELYSLCEHHMLPFFGKAHVAYIPDGKIVGLSKIPRAVDVFARRLQVQERMTMQIVVELQKALGTKDVACVIDAKHLCVNSRGIRDVDSSTVTSEFGGAFKNAPVKREFLDYIKLETEF